MNYVKQSDLRAYYNDVITQPPN